MIGDQKSDRIAAQKSNLYYEDVGKNFFNQIKKIEGVILRLSNGSGFPIFPEIECWHLILNDLCRQAVEKKELN